VNVFPYPVLHLMVNSKPNQAPYTFTERNVTARVFAEGTIKSIMICTQLTIKSVIAGPTPFLEMSSAEERDSKTVESTSNWGKILVGKIMQDNSCLKLKKLE